MGRKIEINELALDISESMPKPDQKQPANENDKITGRVIEIDESVLHFNVEKAADDLVDTMLRRAQAAEVAKRVGKSPFDVSNRTIKVAGPFGKVIEMEGLGPINKAEADSLYTILDFVSFNRSVKKEKIKAAVVSEFKVKRIEKIQRIDFQKAIDFLLNLRLDKLN